MAENTQIPEQISTTKPAENQEMEQTAEQTPPDELTENTVANIFGVPDSMLNTENFNEEGYNNFINTYTNPSENQEEEQRLADIDIIAELTEAVKLSRTKRPEFVAKLIKEILSKDFVQSEGETKYTNAIYEIKEYIGNIKKNCPYRPSKCIVKVECTLKRLNDGDF